MTEIKVTILDNGWFVEYWNGKTWRARYVADDVLLLDFLHNPPKEE